MAGFSGKGRGKKWINVCVCLAVSIFGLYTLIIFTRPDFLFEKRTWKSKTLVMKDNNSQTVSEYGISIGASRMFADGKLGYTNEFSGLCYVKITHNELTEYRWGHSMTINGKWEKGSLTYVTLK